MNNTTTAAKHAAIYYLIVTSAARDTPFCLAASYGTHRKKKAAITLFDVQHIEGEQYNITKEPDVTWPPVSFRPVWLVRKKTEKNKKLKRSD